MQLKRLPFLLTLLVYFEVEGQVLSPVGRRAVALVGLAQSSGLGHDPDLVYWWDASVLVTQTVTNWIDLVSGVIATNGNSSRRPSGAATGVTFASASSQSLTNSPLSLTGTSNTIQIVCQLTTAPAFMPIMSDATGGNPEFGFNSGKPWNFSGTYNVSSPTALPTGQTFDVLFTVGTSIGDTYTNGILQLHQGTAYNYNALNQIGHGVDGFFNGIIKEIRIWTNQFNSTRVATNHTYETNKWGYTP